MIQEWKIENLTQIASYLINGEVVVVPTDTLYGTLAMADNEAVVEEVYRLKGRRLDKPVIILISDVDQLTTFGIKPSARQQEKLERYWPGKVSIILPCDKEELSYLHRDTQSLAFRLPADKKLKELISITGPLIAPSANPEGLEPALNINKAIEYFRDQIGLYVDDGERRGEPSTLISLLNDELKVIRGTLPN